MKTRNTSSDAKRSGAPFFFALDTFSEGQAQHIPVVGERRIGKSSLVVTQTYQFQVDLVRRWVREKCQMAVLGFIQE